MRAVVRPPYWVGWRLIDLAVTRWPAFHGQTLMRTGRDPLELPLPSLLNLIYAWWTGDAGESEVAKFDAALKTPPGAADLETRDEWSDDETDDSFVQAIAARIG